MSNECDTSLVGMTWETPMGEDITNPRNSEYGSIPKHVLNPLTILMKVEPTNGSTLPRENYDTGTILMISHQVMGVSPELIEVLSPYEAMLQYGEGNVLGPIAGELVSITLWEGLPIIISCTIVAPTQAVQIVKWKKTVHRVGIVDPQPALTPDAPTPDRSPRINLEQEALQDRLEQVVRSKNELSQCLEHYAMQQDHVLRLVAQICENLQ